MTVMPGSGVMTGSIVDLDRNVAGSSRNSEER